MIVPWPPDSLFPNKKNGRHWGSSNADKKKYFSDCYYLAKSEKFAPGILSIEFTPPMKKGRAPDLDGCLSAIKPGLDGIAMAWGVDDCIFNIFHLKRNDKQGIGFIEIKIIQK